MLQQITVDGMLGVDGSGCSFGYTVFHSAIAAVRRFSPDAQMFQVECAANQRFQNVVAVAVWCVDAGVGEVTDSWCESVPEEVHEPEDVIGESVGVGVVLCDANIGLVYNNPSRT